MNYFLVLLVLVCLSIHVYATTGKALVIIDNETVKRSHSQFFDHLRTTLNVQVEFLLARDSKISLSSYGTYLYDHLIIMAPESDSFGGDLKSSKTILDFVDVGNKNVMIFSSDVLNSEVIREVASDNQIEFDEDKSLAVDYFHSTSNEVIENRETFQTSWNSILSLQLSQNTIPSLGKRILTPTLYQSPHSIFYRGMCLQMNDFQENNPLLLPILFGYSTTFAKPTHQNTTTFSIRGKECVMVAAVQSRNGARITLVGSMDLFSNRFMNLPQSINREFAQELSTWSLGMRGVIRRSNTIHYQVDVPSIQNYYKITSEIHYMVTLEEWNGKEWKPFVLESDVTPQLELIMLYPYIRTGLTNHKNGTYSIQRLVLPDVYGVYKFSVDLRRSGYSTLQFFDQVTIRPTRISEFERYIVAANPYYFGIASVGIAFLIFIFLFLFK